VRHLQRDFPAAAIFACPLTGWVAEGKLSYIIGDNKEKDPGSFTLKPVALPQ
jgi:hypothetical protein